MFYHYEFASGSENESLQLIDLIRVEGKSAKKSDKIDI